MLLWDRAVHQISRVGRAIVRRQRWATVRRIVALSDALAARSDEELAADARRIRWAVRTGTPLDSVLPEIFALVREAAARELGMRHFPVQLLGGLALFRGEIAEMQTGEGKTLTAVLPTALRALAGRGAHVVTVNDYLAERDAETMGPVYRRLGLSVGCVLADMDDDLRRTNYACDVTYGTAKEMGFDFLRDRLKQDAAESGGTADPGEAPVMRGLHAALVDEADSILIDEARTPLIIGVAVPNEETTVALVRWCAEVVPRLEPQKDFLFDPQKRQVQLTDHGCRRLHLLPKPRACDAISAERLYRHVEQALTARLGFRRDREYVVVEDEVSIVDESTGRIMEGRKWQEGLHQAVEAQEGVPLTPQTRQAARVTVQTFFRRYRHLCGMTGTGTAVAAELRRVYRTPVDVIPTHRPCLRIGLPTRVFATQAAKRAAIAEEIERMQGAGRPVLVGTPSVEASEALGEELSLRGIAHRILHARKLAEEAEIVADAGRPARVTIATNMAGRGTDILLGEGVAQAGGLHVIATEHHSAGRIDRQLIGRAARQGDPGSFRFFVSLEDELLRVLPAAKRQNLLAAARPDSRGELDSGRLRLFLRTQRTLERLHSRQRRDLLRQEREHRRTFRRMGLDPFLELAEDG